MMYLQEASDAIGTDIEPGCTSHYKPEPRVVDVRMEDDSVPEESNKDVRMEDDSVPEESNIACHQEVMTGYENKPIVPTSRGVEPRPTRCAHGAESNETISFIPKQIASENAKDRSSIIHKSPQVNYYEIASAKVSNPTSSDPERVVYKPTSICNMSPRIATDPKASVHTNLFCSTLCNKLATFHESNKNPDPGLVDNVESSAVYVDDESLPLANDTTFEYMGFNHLAYIKGEKITGDVVYPATPPANFSQ